MRLTTRGKALLFFATLTAAISLNWALGLTHIDSDTGYPIPAASPTPAFCQEDAPCWDCTTMGNRICGEGSYR